MAEFGGIYERIKALWMESGMADIEKGE